LAVRRGSVFGLVDDGDTISKLTHIAILWFI
jgi:hypothetical protein